MAQVYGSKTVAEGQIQAIDITTGKIDWVFSVTGVSLSEPTIQSGVLYFVRGPRAVDTTDAAYTRTGVCAFDLKTRDVKWTFEGKGRFDTPALADGTIFVGSNNDFLYAVDSETGKEKWRFKAAARTPIVRDGQVYFSDLANIYAVGAKTGLLKWRRKDSGGVSTQLAVSSSALYYGGNGKVFSVDSATGKVNWSVGIKGQPFEPIIASNRVFVGGSEELLMLDATTGTKFPTVKLGPNLASTPAITDGLLIVDNGDGYLFAIKN